MTKKFSKEYLVNEFDLPWTAEEDHIIENTRWSIIHEIVFKDKDGKYYQTWYSVGATEMQPEKPWEYEDEIECTEVEQKPVTVMQWVPVDR